MISLQNYSSLYDYFHKLMKALGKLHNAQKSNSGLSHYSEAVKFLGQIKPPLIRLLEDIYGIGSSRLSQIKQVMDIDGFLKGSGFLVIIDPDVITNAFIKTIQILEGFIMEGDIPKKYEKAKSEYVILYVMANPEKRYPDKFASLDLNEEFRDINLIFQRTRYREYIKLIPLLATRFNDLESQISYHKPAIIIFSGHGTLENGFIFHDFDDNPSFDFYGELLNLIDDYKKYIVGIVFNNCQSRTIARDVVEKIGFCIGTLSDASDAEAIAFSQAFIESLGNNDPIEVCFNHGLRTSKRIKDRILYQLDGDPKGNTDPLIKFNVDVKEYEDENFFLWLIRSKLPEKSEISWKKMISLAEKTSPRIGATILDPTNSIAVFNNVFTIRFSIGGVRVFNYQIDPIRPIDPLILIEKYFEILSPPS